MSPDPGYHSGRPRPVGYHVGHDTLPGAATPGQDAEPVRRGALGEPFTDQTDRCVCRIRRGARSTDMRELNCIAFSGRAALTTGLVSARAETDAVAARPRIRPRAPPAMATRPQGL
jgi:hypothetical protein